MSYIRNTSNPEKLYIYSDGEHVHISTGLIFIGKVPVNIFDGLIKKFHRNSHIYPCSYKGSSVTEAINTLYHTSFIVFEYEEIELLMYEVTWEYIVYTNK